MADQQFRLPGSSYEELVKIIQSYAHFNGKASNSDISKMLGIDPTTVSRNSGFLIETGIVDRGQKKEISATGKQLARAIEHDISEEIRASWSEVMDSTPFFETILSAIRIRKGMDLATLRSHIGYTAGATKNRYAMTGAQAVIDILRAAGRIEEEDGRFVAKGQEIEPPSTEISGPSHTLPTATTKGPIALSVPTRASVPVSIQIQIQCTPSDLDQLGEKLSEIIKNLKNTEGEPSES